MRKNYFKYLFYSFLITICVFSCDKILCDKDIIQSTTKYDVIYVSEEDTSEYERMMDEHKSLQFSDNALIVNEIKHFKENENSEGIITKHDEVYKITIKQKYLLLRLFFHESEDKYMFYDTYDVMTKYQEVDIDNYGFSLMSSSENNYSFEIQCFLIFKTTIDQCVTFVKVPIYVRGDFDLKSNYLKYEIDL